MRQYSKALAPFLAALLVLGLGAFAGDRLAGAPKAGVPQAGSSRPDAPQDYAPRAGAAELVSLLENNDFRAAERLAAKILSDPAANSRARALCGLAYLKAGRVDEAEKILREVIADSPADPEAHLGLGRLARIRNDTDKAIDHLRRAAASKAFYEEALRQLWKAAWDRGEVDELLEIYRKAEIRYLAESAPFPSWFTNGLGQLKGLEGKRLFAMEGSFERLQVPLTTLESSPRTRMIALGLNGRGDFPFHIDSALADFMTVSPLLAEELGLAPTGGAASTGVGTAAVATRFAVLDEVRLGPIAFRNVPVMVSDVQTLRGRTVGLVGTAFLKRFNVTIDAEAGVMTLFPLERPDLMTESVDRTDVAVDASLLLFDATTVEASLAGAPAALYILDTAAATNLMDRPFFEEHIKPNLDPARIVSGGIRGAGGAQRTNRVDGLSIALGRFVFEGQTAHEFPMDGLNAIGGRYAAGLLGSPILWPYRVHMDFKNGRLVLEKRPEPAR
ncbi:MAG: aspartyl protease family protein [Candidatus Aminicenantes bacterium]|nr:aspartyl protease family protein [Candidatus Aminicenantes bacterium]